MTALDRARALVRRLGSADAAVREALARDDREIARAVYDVAALDPTDLPRERRTLTIRGTRPLKWED